MQAWRAMEAAVQTGLVRQLGISNVRSLQQLKDLYHEAAVKPAVVQQRFIVDTDFENEMRGWCLMKNIYFQSFWTLTANSIPGRPGHSFVISEPMRALANKYGVTPQVLFFRFVMGLGIIPLTGTSTDEHMVEDLAARKIPLTLEDAAAIERLMYPASSLRAKMVF
eukprot:CAMPEP_0179212514 /NCGR_PEP_ID=MMETSP0797-20121207/1151_1 /TAXON_ID=47934 /ORGANISM="Dinophysis acuminata, Strain DAEP01" /LENGTH=165 /DNA_ID=CAMNT_0020918141 /DNA_START=32 /DNA_END=529 /DNA_ORIENTATION=-